MTQIAGADLDSLLRIREGRPLKPAHTTLYREFQRRYHVGVAAGPLPGELLVLLDVLVENPIHGANICDFDPPATPEEERPRELQAPDPFAPTAGGGAAPQTEQFPAEPPASAAPLPPAPEARDLDDDDEDGNDEPTDVADGWAAVPHGMPVLFDYDDDSGVNRVDEGKFVGMAGNMLIVERKDGTRLEVPPQDAITRNPV